MTMSYIDTSSKNRPEDSTDLNKHTVSYSPCELKKNDVISRPDIATITKRVSFNHNYNQAPTLNTIQNNPSKGRITNKTSYLKLHRHSFSPGSNYQVEKLKEKYENPTQKSTTKPNLITRQSNAEEPKLTKTTLQNKLTADEIDRLRQKYSPEGFGYPKTKRLPSKIPVPTPRNSLAKPRPKLETVRTITIPNENLQIPVITNVTPNNFEEIQLIYNNIKFAEPEEKHFIVTRSSSEDSILKVESSLAEFVMEKKPKEKKRSNSFRRILSGGLFGRDKKKQEDDKSKCKRKDKAVFSDNAQNESQVFDRHASHRHTVDSSYSKHSMQKAGSLHDSGPLYYYKPQQHYLNTGSKNVDSRYTDMKGNSMIHAQRPLHGQEDYVQMGGNSRQNNYLNVNRFIDTSSSSSNTDLDSRNCAYQNALIAQAELRQIRENENRKNALKSKVPYAGNSDTSSSSETFRSTPPSKQKAVNVELVKPKALIPINSERPLPNPYRDNNMEPYLINKTIERNLNVDSIKHFPNKCNMYEERAKEDAIIVEDVYGTVFDSISSPSDLKCDTQCNSSSSISQISPRSLEASKLRLPSNREKVELQPRIRSPIPQAKISTDKIIATELLRNKGSPSRSPYGSIERQHTPQSFRNVYENQEIRLPNAHSTPRSTSNEYIHLNTVTSIASSKPPPSPRDNLRARQREQQVTLATVHADATDRSIPPDHHRNRSFSPLHIQEDAVFVPANKRHESPYSSMQNNISFAPPPDTPSQTISNLSEDLYKTRITYSEQISPSYNVRKTVPSPLTVTPHEDPYGRNSLRRFVPQSAQCQRDSIISDTSYATLQQSVSSTRPQTPQNVLPTQQQRSPQKQHMIQNVEAFYWRELKKLKEKEQHDLLNYRQQQFYVYGYAEEPACRRSRSVSPSMQRGRRSLSLPRENQPHTRRISHETIAEGRPLIAKQPIALPNGCNDIDYGQIRQNFQRNPNFVRNTFERTTIGPIGRSRYHESNEQQSCVPIFKRGSLTSEGTVNNETQQANKKVSFSNSMHPNNGTSWPTKNGFNQSPPTRRVEREVSLEDDVFVDNSPRNKEFENIYMNDTGKRPNEMMYESASTKHVTVRNKVCDIYGQIHDSKQTYSKQTVQLPPQNYGQVRQMGYVYGQLQQTPPNQQSPVVLRQSFDYLNSGQSNFVRGTRLTASANDMHRRYPPDPMIRAEFVRNPMQPPNRPLPPVPERRDSRLILAKKFIRGYPQYSDTESGSDAAEVQRIFQRGAKQQSFGAIGK